jgi:hypothetical protein
MFVPIKRMKYMLHYSNAMNLNDADDDDDDDDDDDGDDDDDDNHK